LARYDRPLEGDVLVVGQPDGSSIHSVSLGSGDRAVVLAHGYGFTMDEWNEVAERLVEQGLRVVAFDQRGHGRSTVGADGIGTDQMASAYAAVLEAHDVRDAVLVGHSMGGFLSLAFLLGGFEAADRVGSLLLMATFAGDVSRDNPQNRLQIPLIKSGVLPALLGIGFVARAFTKSLVGDGFEPEFADAFVPTFREQEHGPLVPILRAMVQESRYDRLGELDLPCTVLVGSKDKTTPPFHTADLHAGIAGSRLVTLEGKGHLLNWEAPDAVAEQILGLAG
jgi:non-heme chloroperoxidase